MSMSLRYEAGSAELLVRLKKSDFDVMETLTRVLPEDADAVFGAPIGRDWRGIMADCLASSASRCIDHFACDVRNRAIYSLDYDIVPRVPVRGAMGANGIEINGKLMVIRGGLGRCDLLSKERNLDGIYETVFVRDLRGEEMIECNTGPIFIRQKEFKVPFLSSLEKVRLFAGQHSGQIVKCTVDAPPLF